MIPRLPNCVLRAQPARTSMGQPRLESLAAEFALLTQRRSRALQEIATLDRQRAAAAVNFARLQGRIARVMQQMDAISPDLRGTIVEGEPETVVAHSSTPAVQANDALVEIGRKWINAAQAAQAERSTRPRRSRRI